MAEGAPNKRSVNHDVYNIVKKFFVSSSKDELKHDLLLPIVIAVFIVNILSISGLDILNIFREFNVLIITVMSILAGFNTASIAIISASNLVNFVNSIDKGTKSDEVGRDLLNSLTSYFSYAIMLQLFILIGSILASVILKLIDYSVIETIFYICF
ncbi:hypothetical protein [Bacillus pumilus]|uniref:hypothetical protein n=1 Tax=Bacillus pumilus TaxID=1408 RepID=UPI000DDE0A30|nr:hypothetical protein [Bacillus pumilus]